MGVLDFGGFGFGGFGFRVWGLGAYYRGLMVLGQGWGSERRRQGAAEIPLPSTNRKASGSRVLGFRMQG